MSFGSPSNEAVRLGANAALLAKLRGQLRGDVIGPEDLGYDEARRVVFGNVDRYPRAIARCAGRADVAAAIGIAANERLPLAVRSGGHSMSFHGTCDDGIIIDLSPLKSVEVDVERQTVKVGAGCIWSEVHQATQPFGLGVPSGPIGTVGVGGLSLGGGIGWMARKHGLAADNLLSAEIVTPDGETLRASIDENPDLLWGLCGGGGNFGVVTELEFAAHPAGLIYGGMIAFPLEQGADFLRFYREWAPGLPDEITTLVLRLDVPPVPFVPAELHHRPVYAIALCCLGDHDQAEMALIPLRAFAEPLIDMIGPMPYVAICTMFDDAVVPGAHFAGHSGMTTELGDELIDATVEHVSELPPSLAMLQIQQLGGALARIPSGNGAFCHRDKAYMLTFFVDWHQPDLAEVCRSWVEATWRALRPHLDGLYVGFLGSGEKDRLGEVYDEATLCRLKELKRRYDPSNLLRLNANIEP